MVALNAFLCVCMCTNSSMRNQSSVECGFIIYFTYLFIYLWCCWLCRGGFNETCGALCFHVLRIFSSSLHIHFNLVLSGVLCAVDHHFAQLATLLSVRSIFHCYITDHLVCIMFPWRELVLQWFYCLEDTVIQTVVSPGRLLARTSGGAVLFGVYVVPASFFSTCSSLKTVEWSF